MPKGYRKDGTKLGFQKGHKINIGRLAWNKGKHYSLKTKKKMSESHADFKGDNNPHWKGGRKKQNEYIYIYKPEHPFNNHTYVFEHRLVMEEQIGRYLTEKERVHHLGEKTDNRPHMLMAFASQSAHKRFEQGGKVKQEEIIFDGRNFI